MRRTVSASAALVPAFLGVLATPAAADASGSPDGQGGPGVSLPAEGPARSPLTVGARVGGYGFRNPGTVDDHGHVAWDACRMNGLGVFARRPVGRLFAEAGADLYFAESFPMAPAPGDEAIDRVSGLLTVAIGANVVRTRRVSIHAQLGAGLELTRVAMTMATGEVHKDRRALPVGFVGVGGELHLGARTSLGASLRTHVMGYFEHAGWGGGGGGGHDHGTAALAEPAGSSLEVTPELAAQGQFYVSYRL